MFLKREDSTVFSEIQEIMRNYGISFSKRADIENFQIQTAVKHL